MEEERKQCFPTCFQNSLLEWRNISQRSLFFFPFFWLFKSFWDNGSIRDETETEELRTTRANRCVSFVVFPVFESNNKKKQDCACKITERKKQMQISIEFKKQILKSNILGKWPEDLKKNYAISEVKLF